MKYCKKCGQQIDDDALFCPRCGQKQEEPGAYDAPKMQAFSYNDFNGTDEKTSDAVFPQALSLVKDELFLFVCVLMSVSSLMGLVNRSLPVITILYTVFLWIIYLDGRKNITDPAHIRYLSGTIFATYVINWILAGLAVLMGLGFTTVLAAVNSAGGFDTILNLSEYDPEIINAFNLLSSLSGTVVLLFCLGIAVVVAVLNLFGRRIVHRFVKANYKCMQEANTVVLDSGVVSKWLMIMGIVSAVSEIAGIFGGLTATMASNLCFAAAMIIASILVKKHMSAE